MIEIEIEQWPMSGTFYINMGNSKSYSEPSQMSETELFTKIVNVWNSLAVFIKNTISCVLVGSEYASIIIAKVELLHLYLLNNPSNTYEWQENYIQRRIELFLKVWIFEKTQSNWIELLNIESNFICKSSLYLILFEIPTQKDNSILLFLNPQIFYCAMHTCHKAGLFSCLQ